MKLESRRWPKEAIEFAQDEMPWRMLFAGLCTNGKLHRKRKQKQCS